MKRPFCGTGRSGAPGFCALRRFKPSGHMHCHQPGEPERIQDDAIVLRPPSALWRALDFPGVKP